MADAKQVLIKLVTKLPPELRVPETPVAVPATIKRYGLSQIINHLLAQDPARPFDFIINGELLRKPLEAHLLQHNLSAESVLEVEYVPAVVPPQTDKQAQHDDWVSAVDGSWGLQQVVSGSYDGCLRTWHFTGNSAECTGSWHAHAGGVNSVTCQPGAAVSEQQPAVMYSAGKDGGVLMWQVLDGGSQHQLLASFQGHTDAVEHVAVSPSGKLLASCGWDGRVMTWQAGQQVVDAAAEAAASAPPVPAKKRKGHSKDASQPAAAPEGGLPQQPLSTLQGPGQPHCVSCVVWASEGALYSGGWDHAVRRWDLSTGINTDTYNGSKAVCSLACPAAASSSSPVVAFGCSDKVIRLWDPRAPATGEALAVKAFPSHAGWVVGLAWCPGSQHHLASAAHDHTVKLWDLRSSVPLATLAHHTDKALCVAWAAGSNSGGPTSSRSLLSGGADCKLLSYSVTVGL